MTAIGGNALVQAVSLIIFARSLGAAEFGIIVLATATGAVAAEFVGLGAGDLLIRDVSRNARAHRLAFGRALWLIGLTIAPLSLIATYIAWLSFRTAASFPVLLTLVASEIVAIRLAWLAEQIAIAHRTIHTATANRMFVSLVRLVTVCVAVFVAGVSTAAGWAGFAAASSAIIALGCLTISVRRFGAPLFRPGEGLLHVGFLFSLLQIIRAVQFSLDKFAVASVASTATVGTFGAASRAAQLGIMPASAITRMTYPIFFAKGAAGIDAAVRLAARLAPAVLGVGLLSSAALACVAFALPALLGREFGGATIYVLMMASLPLASALQNLGGDLLTGSDFLVHRAYAAIVGVGATAVATLAGAETAGVSGAIIGYMAGHFLFAAAIWLTVFHLWRRSRGRTVTGA